MPKRNGPARTSRSKVRQVPSGGPATWHDMLDPDQSALSELKGLFPSFHEEDLQDCLPPFQRPKMLRRDNYLFLVLLFPTFDDVTRTVVPYEVDFFIGQDFVVTSHRGTHPVITSLADACNADTGTCAIRQGNTPLRLALDIVHGLTVACFPMVTELSNELIGVERKLFKEDGDGEFTRSMLRIRTNVISFRKAMQGSDNVLRKLLEKGRLLFPTDEYAAQVEEINVHSREIRDFLENDRDTVSALYDAHLALSSYRATEATKTLTALALIILPMTLVAAIFAMHATYMPFAGMPNDFWLMVGCIVATMLVIVLYLKRKKWL